jgi:hypothetical protein
VDAGTVERFASHQLLHTKDQEMNNLSALGIMMSTQLAIEIV